MGRGIFVTLTYTAGTFSQNSSGRPRRDPGARVDRKRDWRSSLLESMAPGILSLRLGGDFRDLARGSLAYPPETEALEGNTAYLERESEKLGAWTYLEKKSLIFMLIATSLWATDLLHHISPAVIGIGVGLLAAVPGIGVLETEDLRRMNYLPVLFTGAAISLGNILIQTQALHALTG